MILFGKRLLVVFVALIVATVVIVKVQPSTRLAFDTLHETNIGNNPHPHHYLRDYGTLWNYTASLALFAIGINTFSRFGSKVPLRLEPRQQLWLCRWREWIYYEGAGWDMPTLIRSTALLAFNLVFLMSKSVLRYEAMAEDDIGVGHRDLYYQEIANRCAQLAVVNIAIAVSLSVRQSFILPASIDARIRWHIAFARVGGLVLLFHICYQLNRNYQRHDHHFLLTFTSNTRYLTGSLMGFCITILVFGSHPFVRTLSYRMFRLSHISAFLGLILLACWHHWAFIIFYVATVSSWCIDHFKRYRPESDPITIVTLEYMPGDILKLVVQSPLGQKAAAGQFVFLTWSRSRLESWLHAHPFSISRIDCHDIGDLNINTTEGHAEDEHDGLPSSNLIGRTSSNDAWRWTFYIKASGRSTAALLQSVRLTGTKNLILRSSQPAGPSHHNFAGRALSDFKVVVLVAEGIGITPWISVIQQLESQHTTTELVLIWTIRSPKMMAAFTDELVQLLGSTHIQAKVHLFLTRTPVVDLEDGPVLPHPNVHTAKRRPDYLNLLREIRSKHPTVDVALGLCAHAESIRQCSNLARSSQFSHGQAQWFVRAERFQLA